MKNKIMALKNLKWLPLIMILTTISCNKENDLIIPIEFFNDGNHVFYFECQDENIEFFIDALSDKSNGVSGSWPNKDIYRIFVDYNRNGTVDSGIDLMFSPKDDNSVCVVSLINQTSTSACSFYDDVIGENLFTSTDNSEEQHVNFKVSIPKRILSNSSSTNIVVQLYDSETGWQYFPSNNTLFSTYFEINW